MSIINPSVALSSGMQYTVTMGLDVVKDMYAGNGFKGIGQHDSVGVATSFTFTTASSRDAIQVTFKNTSQYGYIRDAGAAFSFQSGRYFGWKCDGVPQNLTAGIRDWGTIIDRNAECAGTTTWEMQVANGKYDISVIMPQSHHLSCKVQGVLTGGSSGWFNYSATITVTDGYIKLEGDFPLCHGYQEVVLTKASTVTADDGCKNKLDGQICGPNQELHVPTGECILMVKPAACSNAVGSGSGPVKPLNPLLMVPVPNDERIVPYLARRRRSARV
jgi:hypothetical protein